MCDDPAAYLATTKHAALAELFWKRGWQALKARFHIGASMLPFREFSKEFPLMKEVLLWAVCWLSYRVLPRQGI